MRVLNKLKLRDLMRNTSLDTNTSPRPTTSSSFINVTETTFTNKSNLIEAPSTETYGKVAKSGYVSFSENGEISDTIEISNQIYNEGERLIFNIADSKTSNATEISNQTNYEHENLIFNVTDIETSNATEISNQTNYEHENLIFNVADIETSNATEISNQTNYEHENLIFNVADIETSNATEISNQTDNHHEKFLIFNTVENETINANETSNQTHSENESVISNLNNDTFDSIKMPPKQTVGETRTFNAINALSDEIHEQKEARLMMLNDGTEVSISTNRKTSKMIAAEKHTKYVELKAKIQTSTIFSLLSALLFTAAVYGLTGIITGLFQFLFGPMILLPLSAIVCLTSVFCETYLIDVSGFFAPVFFFLLFLGAVIKIVFAIFILYSFVVIYSYYMKQYESSNTNTSELKVTSTSQTEEQVT